MLFDKDHSIPSTPSNPHTRACGTSMAATNSVSNWEACSRKTLLATGSEILSWGYILLRCCWQHHDRLEMAGCYTASMNHKVLQDFFFSFFFDQLKLLTYSEQKAWLLSCMSVFFLLLFFVRITANNLYLQNAPGAAWLYPASPPNLPQICVSFFSLSSATH